MNNYDYFKLNEEFYQTFGPLTSPIGSSLRPDTLTRVVELARRMDPSPYPKQSQNYLVFDGSPADLIGRVEMWLYDELDIARFVIYCVEERLNFPWADYSAFDRQKDAASLKDATAHESQLLQLLRMLGA